MLYLRTMILVVAPLSVASLTLSPAEAAAKAAWLAKQTTGKIVPTGAHPVNGAPTAAPQGAAQAHWQAAMNYEDRAIGYSARGSSGGPTAYESGMMQPTTNWGLQPYGVDKPTAPGSSALASTPPTPAAAAETAWQAAEAYENRVIGYGAHGSSGGPTAYESGMMQPTTNWALSPFGIDAGMGQRTPGAAAPVDYSTLPISQKDVLAAQDAWGKAIVTISQVHASGGDFVGAAAAAAGELYGYGHTDVLFKPTKAAEYPFRPTANEAMSYFVGGDAPGIDGYAEDHGFAINGGKGWKAVKFFNHQIDLNADTAIAMGTYVFTCAQTGAEANVEYTFGYKRNADGKLRVFLHHSSVPYGPH